jgi:formylglycine-generating enzyme required for sulfatase activity
VRKDSRGGDDAIEQTVTLSRSFLLADREVTRAQFQQFIDDPDCPDSEKPKDWPGADAEYSPTEQHPVQKVEWYDAVLFCNWLSRKEGLTPCYERTGEKEKDRQGKPTPYDAWRLISKANGYRLPTEAEWEYACRAGTVTTFSHGDDESLLDRYAVFLSSRTELPGSKLPNGWGLFDVHGNVWERCHDRYGPFGSDAAVSDPSGPSQRPGRVLRGGSFHVLARSARSANRLVSGPDGRLNNLGFRVARTYPFGSVGG